MKNLTRIIRITKNTVTRSLTRGDLNKQEKVRVHELKSIVSEEMKKIHRKMDEKASEVNKLYEDIKGQEVVKLLLRTGGALVFVISSYNHVIGVKVESPADSSVFSDKQEERIREILSEKSSTEIDIKPVEVEETDAVYDKDLYLKSSLTLNVICVVLIIALIVNPSKAEEIIKDRW